MDDRQLINYIKQYQREHGFPPTIREMADAQLVNEKTIRNRLRRLAEEEEVTWKQGGHRTVQVRRGNMKGKTVPM